MSRTNKLFMAFSKGTKSSEEGAQLKRYIGVASVKVLGVNPTKTQLEDFYKTTIDNEPNYLGEVENDDKKIKTVRVDFIVKVAEGKYKDAEGNDIDLINRITFFIRNEYKFNRDKTKVQVIDKYGRTAWPTIEEAKNHVIPTVGSGNQARIDSGYRPAFVGEEELTEFLKTFLNIPSVEKWSNRQIVGLIDNPDDALSRLEHITDYFSGNISEIADIVKFQPENKVKVLFGIKTTESNKKYQDVYTRMFLRNGNSDYSKLDGDVKAAQNAGAYPNTVFEVCDLHEYVETPTNFSNIDDGNDMPADISGDFNPFAPSL